MSNFPEPTETAGKQISRKRRILLWALYTFIFLLITGIGLSSYVIYLARSNAPYWQTTDASQPAVQTRAINFKNKLISDLHDTHEGEWDLVLGQDQINAWLSYRLPMWIDNENLHDEWVGKAKGINVHINGDGLRVMFIPPDSDIQATLLFVPQQDEAGEWELYLQSILAGRLTMPKGIMLPAIAKNREGEMLRQMYVEVRDTQNDEQQALKDKLIEKYGSWQAVEAEASARAVKDISHLKLELPLALFGLDKNRKVKVANCMFTNGKITLTCKTIPDE